MNPLLLLGGGGVAAYLLLKSREASAATAAALPSPLPEQSPPLALPSPRPPASTLTAPPRLAFGAPPTPAASQPGPLAKPPLIAMPAPSASTFGEIAAPKSPVVQLAGRWGWPVPQWQGRAPVISDGYGSPRPSMLHAGVDVMFARMAGDPFGNGPNGSKLFVMPDAWMAVAAGDGVLWSASRTPRGFAVVVDHGNVATFYQHLDTLLVPPTTPPPKGTPHSQMISIRAGQPLGVIGADPLDPGGLKHLHFELWPGGPKTAIDPAPLMKGWQVFTPYDIAPFLSTVTRNAAKNSARRSEFVPVRSYERRWPGTSLNPPR